MMLTCLATALLAGDVIPPNDDPTACFCEAVPEDGVRVAYIGDVHAGDGGNVLTVEKEVCGGECGVHPAGTDIALGSVSGSGRSLAFQVDGAWTLVALGSGSTVETFVSSEVASNCTRDVALDDAIDFILNHDCAALAARTLGTDGPQAASNEGCVGGGAGSLIGLLVLGLRRRGR